MSTPQAGRKLSVPQRRILAALLRFHKDGSCTSCGVPLKWLRGRKQHWNASESAAFSRSLRRLEQRGLVVRTNTVTGITSGPRAGCIRQAADEPHTGRTNYVILTEAGRLAAETVNKIRGVKS